MQTPAGKKRGCLFYGCLGVGVAAVLAVVVLFFVGRYALNRASEAVQEYTAPAPAELPVTVLPPEERAALEERLQRFQTALEHPTNVQELVLNADQLNALLADRGLQATNAPRVYVQIEDDQLKGNISVPLRDLGPLKLDGRYLNGLATFNLQLTNDTLSLRIDDVEVKGQRLPDVILSELRKQNFAPEFQKDPEFAKLISKFDSIEVRDGQLILRNKVQ